MVSCDFVSRRAFRPVRAFANDASAMRCGSLAAFVLAGMTLLAPAAAKAQERADCVPPAASPASDESAAASYVDCLVKAGRNVTAVTWGEGALRRGTVSARLLSALARAYEDIKDAERAEEYQTRAHELDPDDPLIASRLAGLLYDRLLAASPEERRARRQAGLKNCLGDSGRERMSRAAFTALARRIDGLLAKAVAGFESLGDERQALDARESRALLHVTVQGAKAIPELAAVASEAKARAAANGQAELSDTAAFYLLNLSTAYESHGRHPEALATAEEAVNTAATTQTRQFLLSATARLRGDASATDMVRVIAGVPSCEVDLRAAGN